MNVLMFFLVICIIICSILILFIHCYNKFQNCFIRLNEAEAFDVGKQTLLPYLLNKSIHVIQTNTKIEKEDEVLSEIVKLRSRKLSNFELDRKLYDSINEFLSYKEKYAS